MALIRPILLYSPCPTRNPTLNSVLEHLSYSALLLVIALALPHEADAKDLKVYISADMEGAVVKWHSSREAGRSLMPEAAQDLIKPEDPGGAQAERRNTTVHD